MQLHLRAPPSAFRFSRPCRGAWRPACSTRAAPTLVEQATISTDDQTRLSVLIDRFKSFDVDGNGMIDREELRHLLESVDSGSTILLHAQHWLPEEELDRVMATYDKDKNGVIDFEEFQSIVYDGLLLDGMLSDYEDAFNAVDKTGNGSIGAMELMQLFQALGHPVSFEKLSDIMLQYDRDESGQIEFGEFLMMFRDELLDLQAIKNYMTDNPVSEGRSPSQTLLDAQEGEISIIFSTQELEEALSHTDKMTVVFSAMTWCRPCKAMQRPAQKLAHHYRDSFNFVKLFGNSNQQTKHMFKNTLKVRSTPCFMIFKGKELLHTQTGKNAPKLEDAMRSYIEDAKLPTDRLYGEDGIASVEA